MAATGVTGTAGDGGLRDGGADSADRDRSGAVQYSRPRADSQSSTRRQRGTDPGGLTGGQHDGDDGAAFRAIGGRRGTAVQFDEMPDNGETEAGAARSPARLVHSIEPLEHAREILGRNTGTGIR